MIRTLLLLTVLFASVAGCQTSSNVVDGPPDDNQMQVAAFFPGSGDTGVLGAFDQAFGRAVDDPANTIVAVFSDGTDSTGENGECLPGNMPKSFRDWGTSGMGERDVVVFYLCTQIVESTFNIAGQERSKEIEDLLDRLIERGVLPGNIFVLGHSSGASATLQTAGRVPEKLNAAVVAAPGYGYAYLEEDDLTAADRLFLNDLYDKWRARLAGYDDMTALVFLFVGDAYTPPEDALFLDDYSGVELLLINKSGETGALCADGTQPHFYWWSSCFRNDAKSTVEDYISQRFALGGDAAL